MCSLRTYRTSLQFKTVTSFYGIFHSFRWLKQKSLCGNEKLSTSRCEIKNTNIQGRYCLERWVLSEQHGVSVVLPTWRRTRRWRPCRTRPSRSHGGCWGSQSPRPEHEEPAAERGRDREPIRDANNLSAQRVTTEEANSNTETVADGVHGTFPSLEVPATCPVAMVTMSGCTLKLRRENTLIIIIS